jgi:hypothetical protein
MAATTLAILDTFVYPAVWSYGLFVHLFNCALGVTPVTVPVSKSAGDRTEACRPADKGMVRMGLVQSDECRTGPSNRPATQCLSITPFPALAHTLWSSLYVS